MSIKEWFEANKVTAFGGVLSLLMLIQQLTRGVDKIEWPAVAIAAGVFIAGWVGKNLRGQNNSILGIIGNAGWAIKDVYNGESIDWLQVVIQFVILYVTTSIPDPKPRGYEWSKEIVDAKVEGQQQTPSVLTNTEVKEEARGLMGK